MSYFDDASLVMIPSGYKDQKVYSVKPLDGSGDLTFSRASSATRVASNGLIEKVRTNLITYSQALTNASWSQVNIATATAGQTDPNGGTGATTFTGANGSNAIVTKDFATTSGTPYTISIYIKGASSGTINFNHSGSTLAPQNTISYTTSWQRFTYSFVADSSTSTLFLGAFFSWDNGEQITFAFGQAETGDIATDYIATTSAAVSVGPVSGLPRLDYLNSTCPRLLLEPQRTNSVTYSEQFDNAAWQKTAAGTGVAPAVTANYATSPSGYQDADLVVFNRGAGNTSSDFSWIYQNFVTSAATYTISCYVKAATSADVGKNLAWRNFGGGAAWDVTLTNEWQRISVQATGSGSTQEVGFYNRGSYTSANSVSVLMWGFQAEVGAYATSYIPTLGTSVTRVADAASKTGISSLIGQTEGTLFFDLPAQNLRSSDYQTLFLIYNNAGLANKYFHLYKTINSTQLTFEVFNGTAQCGLGYTMAQNTRYKIAAVYKNNRFELWVNGTLVGNDTSGTIATNTYDTMEMAYDSFNSNSQLLCSQAIVFKTALTQAQLAELTTL